MNVFFCDACGADLRVYSKDEIGRVYVNDVESDERYQADNRREMPVVNMATVPDVYDLCDECMKKLHAVLNPHGQF